MKNPKRQPPIIEDAKIRVRLTPSLRYKWGVLIVHEDDDGATTIRSFGWATFRRTAEMLADKAAARDHKVVCVTRVEWFHGNRVW